VIWEGLSPPYSTIVADPPWHYDERLIEYGKAAPMPYSTMSDVEIARLPVMDLAGPGAHLYLWTTNQHLWVARDIAYGWGFDPVQVLVWAKPPSGLGPGGVFAQTTEFVIYARFRRREQAGHVGAAISAARESAGLSRADLVHLFAGHYKNADSVKAQISNWELGKNTPSDLDWSLLCEALPTLVEVERPVVDPTRGPRVDSTWWTWPRGRHSEKPAAFLDVVERVSPGPYVELFARAPRLGWDSWGKGYEVAS
jgi:N6-adenosine-specific RNA methylase IME4